MSRVLVLGGTGWLGGRVARAARDRGDEVVCLARGASGGVPDGVELVRADRLRPEAYELVRGPWDDVIELAFEPRLVGPALDALAERAAHWTLVSSISVYADTGVPGADESAALVEPRDLTQYADAKVAAERASAACLGDRLLVARPGLIAGPGDGSDRLGYWLARLRRGGRVLVPRLEGRFVQAIDVDDLAAWISTAGAGGRTGAVDAVGGSHPFRDFLDAAGAVAGFDGELVEVDDAALLAHDVRYWAGPRSLPLWLPLADTGFVRRSGAAYAAAGGRRRPLGDLLAGVLADEERRGLDRARRSGLTAVEERAVLAAGR